MGLQDLLDDGKSQPRTDHGAAVDLVDLVVAIPDQGGTLTAWIMHLKRYKR